MSNQSRTQVIAQLAHVATVALRSNATPSPPQNASVGQQWPPRCVCHYGTRKPQTMGPTPKTTTFLGRGNSRAIRHSLFVLSDPQPLAKGLHYDHHCPAD